MTPIPQLYLGTAMWGWTITPDRCFSLLDQYYQAGFREIDGATNYPINKQKEDFRKSEQILQDWIRANGVQDLRVMMKVGSLNNMRSPEHNLQKSFILMCLDEYTNAFGDNLDTLMIHWDNREREEETRETMEALNIAVQQGLKVGLSGIRHPRFYESLNREFKLDFTIQIKHNLLHSDYNRYLGFQGKPRFITYGINGGGIKLNVEEYTDQSSLKTRGGNTEEAHPISKDLLQVIQKENEKGDKPAITNFNHCGMTFAYHSPDILGMLIGPSSADQLQDSISFHQHLGQYDYSAFFQKLKEIRDHYAKKA